MRIADAIARWLADKGITLGFGIIGGGNVVLWDAIAELGHTELVCCHHEQAAAMAAAYYARSKQCVGFALVTTGAGSANAITGVMAAYMDGIPLLVISGNEASHHMSAPTRVWGVQGYDSSGLVSGKAVKHSTRLMSGFKGFDLEHRIAVDAPQGPVWIDIPKDVQGAAL
jgi:acetolactate synthase I/II/III large subunit